MLRKFAVALVATTLLAGTAFAAEQASGAAGAASAAPSAPAAASTIKADTAKPAKAVKHASKTARMHHLTRGKASVRQAHHVKPVKTHQAKTAESAKRS